MANGNNTKKPQQRFSAFQDKHKDLLAELDDLRRAYDAATVMIKAVAKEIVQESGEALERTHDGIHLHAWPCYSDSFDLSKANGADIEHLMQNKALTVDAKQYKAVRENGNINERLDSKIRTKRLKSVNSKVNLVVDSGK